MAKKKPQPTNESLVKRDLRTPKYKLRVVENEVRAYNRKPKHKGRIESFPKLAA
jgi:hypothetical protein